MEQPDIKQTHNNSPPKEEQFFATQIQQDHDPNSEREQFPPEEDQDDSLSEDKKENPLSLKALLSSFNAHDKEEKGLISIEQAQHILEDMHVFHEAGTHRPIRQSPSITP